MNLFHFQEGSSELLLHCSNLWDLFIQNQIQNAGVMQSGIKVYLQSQYDSGLLAKANEGKLHIQLVYTRDKDCQIGFCITSLSRDNIGEVEALYIKDKYQGNNLGTKLLERSFQWMEKHNVLEQKLIVAAGNEQVFSFYKKFGFYHSYTTLFRV